MGDQVVHHETRVFNCYGIEYFLEVSTCITLFNDLKRWSEKNSLLKLWLSTHITLGDSKQPVVDAIFIGVMYLFTWFYTGGKRLSFLLNSKHLFGLEINKTLNKYTEKRWKSQFKEMLELTASCIKK